MNRLMLPPGDALTGTASFRCGEARPVSVCFPSGAAAHGDPHFAERAAHAIGVFWNAKQIFRFLGDSGNAGRMADNFHSLEDAFLIRC